MMDDGVVLIRCLDGYLEFLDGFAVVSAPVAFGGLSPFFALVLVTILNPFLDPAGSPKSTQNATFGGK